MASQHPLGLTTVCVCLALMTGCSNTNSLEDPTKKKDDPTTEVIGLQGGTVETPDGKIKLEIPQGAVEKEVEITVRSLDDSRLPQGGVPGSMIRLLPDGLTFNKPVTLQIGYDGSVMTSEDERSLHIVQVLEGGKLAATKFHVNRFDERSIQVKIDHFSDYAIVNLIVNTDTVKAEFEPVTDVDVLFVVDNSGSMIEEQENLAANFDKMIAALDASGINFRAGVISPDLGAGPYRELFCVDPNGDEGKLRTALETCDIELPHPWIEKTNGETNVPGNDLTKAFSCLAKLGTEGCGYEQQLEAIRLALDENTNPGFRRDHAGLAVVLISDEDDCSAEDLSLFDPSVEATQLLGPTKSTRCTTHGLRCSGENPNEVGVSYENCVPSEDYLYPVQPYVDFIENLKPNRNVVVAAITGTLTYPDGHRGLRLRIDPLDGLPVASPSCEGGTGAATPPIRIAEFVNGFGARGRLHSICSGNFSPALSDIGQMVAAELQARFCMEHKAADSNPETPVVEPLCRSVTVEGLGDIPPCTPTTTDPCYVIDVDSTACDQDQSRLRIRNAATHLTVGATITAECLVD